MPNNKIIILIAFLSNLSVSCTKHEALPELEPRTSSVSPIVYPYGGNAMVQLDSSRVTPWGGSGTTYFLKGYVSVNDSILMQYATKYSKITVYSGNSVFGDLPYPNKSFGKLVTSGQVFKFHFTLIDTAGAASVSSPVYTITIP